MRRFNLVGMVALLIGVVLVALGVIEVDFGGGLLATAVLATPGQDGGGVHLSGDGNYASVENANRFSPDLIAHEYDRKVVMMGVGGVPVNMFMRHLKHKKVNNMKFSYFSVDLRQTKAIVKTQVSAGGVQQNVDVGDLHTIFDISDQVRVSGVNGYCKGVEKQGYPYNVIVIGKTTDTVPKLIIQPINGAPTSTAGSTTGLAIPQGATLYRMTNLVKESQNYNQDATAYPNAVEQYCQIFMTTISETELSKTESKEADWGMVQLNELATHQMLKDEEAAILMGVKSYTKQLLPEARWVYTFDGFEAQAIVGGSPIIQKSKAALEGVGGEAELVDFYRKIFVGNSGSSERYMFAGSGVISTLSKVKLKDNKFLLKNEGTYEQFGVTFSKMTSLFGTLLVMHHPTLDEYGNEDSAFVIDLAYADKMVREPLQKKQISVEDFRGDKVRLLENFAPVFKYPKTHGILKLTA